MKRFLTYVALVLVIGLTVTSCYSSRNCGGTKKSMGQGIHR